MKFVLRDLKLGDQLRGRVAELLDGHELLISFEGDLIRVQNETQRPFRAGDVVAVVVKAIAPLRFQLVEEKARQRRRGHLDVSI